MVSRNSIAGSGLLSIHHEPPFTCPRSGAVGLYGAGRASCEGSGILLFFIATMEAFNYDAARWHRLRDRVMRRDNYQCQLSKRYGMIRQAELVHHIFPVADYPEYAYCAWNLISLSRVMHNKLHDRVTDELTQMGMDLLRRTARKQGIAVWKGETSPRHPKYGASGRP